MLSRPRVAPSLVPTSLCAALVLLGAACSSSNSDAAARATSSGDADGAGGSFAAGGAGGSAAGGAAGACDAPGAPAPLPDAITCSKSSTPFASHVVDHEFGTGQALGQEEFPLPVFGPPEGTGVSQGATSGIVSLGNGGWVILGFEDNAIVDAPGPDFIVFENAFYAGGSEDHVFAELASVAVSDDGMHWQEFPCSASEPPYGQCAGWHPVLANSEENDVDPRDPAVAGGDAFDLADVCLTRARYVRITDRPDLAGSLDGVFDLDAVSIVHAACETE